MTLFLFLVSLNFCHWGNAACSDNEDEGNKVTNHFKSSPEIKKNNV